MCFILELSPFCHIALSIWIIYCSYAYQCMYQNCYFLCKLTECLVFVKCINAYKRYRGVGVDLKVAWGGGSFWSGEKSWETCPLLLRPWYSMPYPTVRVNTLVAHWKAKLFPPIYTNSATIQHFLIFTCGNQNIISPSTYSVPQQNCDFSTNPKFNTAGCMVLVPNEQFFQLYFGENKLHSLRRW
jgi:hypothetical protein